MPVSPYVVAAMLSAAALPARGQELSFSAEPTEACLAAADAAAREACVGRAAEACIDTPDGYTTVGMGFCLGRELEFWDGRLNAAYRALMAREEAVDAEMESLGTAAPSPAEALREMQRAWMAFRDAACAYERSQWGGGTGGGPASAECMMRLTAEQALTLEGRVEEGAR
jgi:uncharacterized protein YecT (DUF1311 family)